MEEGQFLPDGAAMAQQWLKSRLKSVWTGLEPIGGGSGATFGGFWSFSASPATCGVRMGPHVAGGGIRRLLVVKPVRMGTLRTCLPMVSIWDRFV